MSLFQVEDARISYGKRPVIQGASFRLEQGEFCALLGLNGSGKTTLLHGICGLIPMEGSCRVNEDRLDCLNEKQRARLVSFIPQVSGLSGERSVLEVVMMGFNARLGLFSSPGPEHRQKAMDALKLMNYEDFAERDFGSLSQGQKQVVILARCLVQDTPLMLMDEPDSAMDFLNKHMILERIRSIIRSEGKTGLITMHDPNFAMNYCDRLILLRDGRIIDELDMRTDKPEDIERKLSLIYGPIEIVPCSAGYLMCRKE